MFSKYFFGEPLPLSNANTFPSLLEETRTELGLGSVTVLNDQDQDMAPPKLTLRKNKKIQTKTHAKNEENRPKKPKMAAKRKKKIGQDLKTGDCHPSQVFHDKSQEDVNMESSFNTNQEVQKPLLPPHESPSGDQLSFHQGVQYIQSCGTVNRPKEPKMVAKRKEKIGQDLKTGDCHPPQVFHDKLQEDVNMEWSFTTNQEVQKPLVPPHESPSGDQLSFHQGVQYITSCGTVNRPKKPKMAVKRKENILLGQDLNAGDYHPPQVFHDKSQEDVNMEWSFYTNQEVQKPLVPPHESPSGNQLSFHQGVQYIPSCGTINSINNAFSQYFMASQREGRETNPTDFIYDQAYATSTLALKAKTSRPSKVIRPAPYPRISFPFKKSTIMTINKNSGIRTSSIQEIFPPQQKFCPSSPFVSQMDFMPSCPSDQLFESPFDHGFCRSCGIERNAQLPKSKPVTCAEDISMTTHVFLNEACFNEDHFGTPPVAKRKSRKTESKIKKKIKKQPTTKCNPTSKTPRGRNKKGPSLAIKTPPIRRTKPLKTSEKQSGAAIKTNQERSWFYRWFWPSSLKRN